ncbi:hypothetical protein QBC37DRAFT_78731 [Rhypophila decipiens]|uniref:Uncharacterized protein n=1 Tax=Rhypophila decipiens TaxID=261697 RepID=A0AAN6XWV7_9PEZI|nr:hypothetical protein QBC37DRAFT_78731 [Rhypophila decipiens]
MASSSQDMPTATTETPYRDDPDAADSSPLLTGEQTAAGDEEQGIAAPAATSEDAASPDPPRRQFNFIRFHLITLILSVIVVVGIIAFMIGYVIVGGPDYYGLPYPIDTSASAALPVCAVVIAWAGLAIFRHRRGRPLQSLGVATVLHGTAGFFIFIAAGNAADGLGSWYGGGCRWRSGEGCRIFDKVFWYVVLIYAVLLFVISILQCIQFVACLTTVYRSRIYSRGSDHGFMLPGGQISIEFSIRFLRQDAPPPAPIRGLAPPPPPPPPPPPRPASPPPLISTE